MMVKITPYKDDRTLVHSAIEKKVQEMYAQDRFFGTSGGYYDSSYRPPMREIIDNAIIDYKPEKHEIKDDIWLNPNQVVSIMTIKNTLTGQKHVRIKMTDGKEYDDSSKSASEFMLKQAIECGSSVDEV